MLYSIKAFGLKAKMITRLGSTGKWKSLGGWNPGIGEASKLYGSLEPGAAEMGSFFLLPPSLVPALLFSVCLGLASTN